MTIHKALHPRDDIDYMCQGKNEVENTSALKITLIHRYDGTKTVYRKSKERKITVARNNTDNTRIN